MKKILILVIYILISITTLTAQTDYVLSFDGTNDYVSIPDNPVFDINKVTIEMWIYWGNNTAANDVDFLIAKNMEELEIHTGGGSGNHGLRFIPTDKVYLDTGTDVFQSETWHHVAFIYDPSISLHKCYIDGIEKPLTNHGDSSITKTITQSAEPLKIGMRQGNVMSFQGKIDEVRIWNIVRSQVQIQNNMNIKLVGNEDGLIAYYNMDAGSGLSLTDNSTNDNTGTLNNGVNWVLSDSPMPVELVSFTAEKAVDKIILNWSTASELNNYGFEIERASLRTISGKDVWEKIGFVSGAGNRNSPKEYSFIDANPVAGNLQYRIKQIDIDGKSKYYTNIAEINYILTDVKEKQLPAKFALEQNYPNPFNPITNIQYAVSNTQFVSIKVYDILGNEVTTLVNEIKVPGYYNVNFDAANLSTGIYLYRINAGEFTTTKKLMLMK